MSGLWDWYRLPTSERQRIAGDKASMEDLTGFLLQDLSEIRELHCQVSKGAGE